MRTLTALAAAVALAVTAACATMNVSAHLERGVNFAEFVTYEWGPPDNLPVGDPRLRPRLPALSTSASSPRLQGEARALAHHAHEWRLATAATIAAEDVHHQADSERDYKQLENAYTTCKG